MKRKLLGLVLALAMICSLIPAVSLAAPATYGNMTTEDVWVVVTGSGAAGAGNTQDLISKEKAYSLQELKTLAGADVDKEYHYTSLNTNSPPTKRVWTAKGIQLNTLMSNAGITLTDNDKVSFIDKSSPSPFIVVFDPSSNKITAERKVYPHFHDASNQELGAEIVPNIIAWAYPGNTTAPAAGTTITWPAAPDKATPRNFAGQLAFDGANNQLFNSNSEYVVIGDEITTPAININNTNYTRAQILRMPRASRDYTFEKSGGMGKVTETVRGVPIGELLKSAADTDIVKFTAADGFDIAASGMTKAELVAGNYMLAYEKLSNSKYTGIYSTAKDNAAISGYFTLYGDNNLPAKNDQPSKMVTKIEIGSEAVTGLNISEASKTIEVGQNFSLTAEVLPASAFVKSVAWSSSDDKIATVDRNGKVTATGAGTATITAKTRNGSFSKTCAVTVLIPKYSVKLTSTNNSQGKVAGEVSNINMGTSVTVTATPSSGYRFGGWMDGSTIVSRDAKYTFTLAKETSLTGRFFKIGIPSVSAKSNGYNQIILKWKGVTGAAKYEVYRSDKATGKYTRIGTTTSSSFVSTGLKTNKPYYYKVRAICMADVTKTIGGYSTVKYAKPVPAAPKNLKAVKASSSSAKVTWSKVAGVTKYEVYKATSKAGKYVKASTPTLNGVKITKLAKGKTYYFKVRAYKLVGSTKVYGPFSAYIAYKQK